MADTPSQAVRPRPADPDPRPLRGRGRGRRTGRSRGEPVAGRHIEAIHDVRFYVLEEPEEFEQMRTTRTTRRPTMADPAADRPIRVYLAGPMSGLPGFKFPAFHAAAARLRAFGYTSSARRRLRKPTHGSTAWEPTCESWSRASGRCAARGGIVAEAPKFASALGLGAALWVAGGVVLTLWLVDSLWTREG